MRIHSFAHKGLKRLYEEDRGKGVPAESLRKLRHMLAFLEAMADTEELLTPALKWKAHLLSGDRAGIWALNVTANWRLTFRVDDQDRLCDLNLEDYH